MIVGSEQAGEIVTFGALPVMIGLISLLISGANMLWTWIAKGQTATADRVKLIENEAVLLKQRVIQLEGDYKHLPTKDDVNGLRVQLTQVLGEVRSSQTEISGVKHTVGRIDEFLREKA